MSEASSIALPMGTPGWLRAQDIQFVADQRDEDGYEFTSPVSQASLDPAAADGERAPAPTGPQTG